jgi:hypothetical protein
MVGLRASNRSSKAVMLLQEQLTLLTLQKKLDLIKEAVLPFWI